MSRKSARYVARDVGLSTGEVYGMWKDMGLVDNKLGDWKLTDKGRENGGKTSKSGYNPVPTFESDTIIDKMIKHYKKAHK